MSRRIVVLQLEWSLTSTDDVVTKTTACGQSISIRNSFKPTCAILSEL